MRSPRRSGLFPGGAKYHRNRGALAARAAAAAAIFCLALIGLPSGAYAQLFWDGGTVNGGNPLADANGGTGTWNTTLTNWDTAATGGADAVWVNGAIDASFGAFSGGGTSTVTLGEPITAHSLTFSGRYTLTGSTLTLTGATPTITGSQPATISSVIAGTAGLTKTGTNTLTLNGVSTFTGGVTLVAGTLTFDSVADAGVASALGAAGTIVAAPSAGGVVLSYNGTGNSSNRDWTLQTATSTAVTLRNSGTGKLTLTGGILLTGLGITTTTFSATSADLDLLGMISSSGSIKAANFSGSVGRTITLGGANTYSGVTAISGVTVIASVIADRLTASSFGTSNGSTGGISISGGGTVSYTGVGASSDRLWTLNNGTLRNDGSGALTLSGTVGITNTATLGGSFTGASTISGVISGGGALTINTAGTWTLGGNNTYTGGTTISSGRIDVGANTALGTGALTIAPGATLGFSAAGLTLANSVQLSGPGAAIVDTGASTETLSGVVSGAGGLTKNGSGMLVLSGTNTYTGATLINAGTLQAGSAAGGQAFGNLSAVSQADVAGATLDLNGFDQTIGSLAGGGATGGNVTLGSAALTTGGDNTSTDYAGVIAAPAA